jgi:AAA family ATP:ADP antiporter
MPLTLGTTAVVILSSGALGAARVARVLDSSLRYTIDKTAREVLFLPLPVTLKYRAKPFVDVTIDRTAKAIGALLALVLIKPLGLHLGWRSLSMATLVTSVLWIFLAMRARREYLKAFRHSLDAGALVVETPRLDVTDASTIELPVQELSRPKVSRVLSAIDILEMLGKSNLVTPLLLHHDSDAVRARAIVALASAPPTVASSWMPHVERVLRDQTMCPGGGDSCAGRSAARGCFAADPALPGSTGGINLRYRRVC